MTATLCILLTLTACGVKRPLMRPSEVPAYEAERAKVRAEREKERQQEPR